MKFTAIDFETANYNPTSACSVGHVVVDNGCIVQQYYQLIRPEPLHFIPHFVSIHKINESDVINSPTFADYWPILLSSVSGPLVAHKASFDMEVLCRSLSGYGIPYPDIEYFCTLDISRLLWSDQPSHSLDHMADFLGISFIHHNAVEDARACALIAIEACKRHNVKSLYDLYKRCGLSYGRLTECTYTSEENSHIGHRLWLGNVSPRAKDLYPSTDEFSPLHPFYQKSFAFTGEMTSMSRREAMQSVIDHGGICHDTVKRGTDFLVVSDSEKYSSESLQKTKKFKMAKSMLSKCIQIVILSEIEFKEMI